MNVCIVNLVFCLIIMIVLLCKEMNVCIVNLVFCLIIVIVLLCKRDECLYCKSSLLSHYYDCVIV